MSVVAVLVFSHGCHGCIEFKDVVYEDHKSVFDIISDQYKHAGLTIKTFYNTDSNLPEYLRITSFFPTLFLMPSNVFYNGNSMLNDDIYNKIKVFDAKIEKNANDKYVVGKYEKRLDYLRPSDYMKFLNEYNNTTSTKSFVKPDNNRLISEGHRINNTGKHHIVSNGKVILLTYK